MSIDERRVSMGDTILFQDYIAIAMIICAMASILYAIISGNIQKKKHGHTHRGFGHKHDGSVFSIDYYAYNSKLRSWNPKFKTILAVACLLICIISNNLYVEVTVIFVMAYLLVVIGGLDFSRYLSLMTIPIVFMIFGSIAIAMNISTIKPDFPALHVFSFYIYTSKENILEMLRLIGKAFGAVSAMYMLTLSTPAGEIITVLRSAHVPAIMVELMNMIYRYIFLLMDTHCRMKNSAISRLGYCDYPTSLKSFGMIAANLLTVSLKKGNAYYQALEARCYDGELRFWEEEKPLQKNHLIFGILLVLILIGLWFLTK